MLFGWLAELELLRLTILQAVVMIITFVSRLHFFLEIDFSLVIDLIVVTSSAIGM